MRRVVQILAAVVFLAGLVLFLGPQVNGWLGQRNSDSAIDTFEAELPAGAASSGEGESGKAADGDTSEDSEEGESDADSADQYFEEVSAESLAALRSELEAYNRQLYESGQSGLRDPFDYENSSFDLTRYGFSQNVIGVLWIPRMQEKLPIYLGANSENMAKGAGLMGQTSMPLGELNSNVAIAAHRGWKGIPMFQNIQQIQIGDKIQITTPWDVLIYRVCDLKIISPDDSQEIFIQEGRELVTLLTCHPYTHNYQRYLVFAERSDEEPQTMEEDLAEVGKTWDPSPREVEDISGKEPVTVQVDPSALAPSLSDGAEESGAGYSNLQIWLETYGVWIFLAVAVVIVAAAVILTGHRKRHTQAEEDHRKNRRRRRRRKR